MFDGVGTFATDDLISGKQLFARVANGDLAALGRYLAKGGNIDSRDEDGLALIHYAACHGNITLIRKLKEQGADMNLLDGGSPPWKPVHYAIFHRKHEAQQALKEFGAEMLVPLLKRVMLERSQECSNQQINTGYNITR